MRHFILLLSTLTLSLSLQAQPTATADSSGLAASRVLTLKECRRLALDNSKGLAVGRLEKEIQHETHLAAGTNYMPKVTATAGYVHTNKSVSLLNRSQITAFNTAGTNLAEGLLGTVQNILANYPDLAPLLGLVKGPLGNAATAIDGVGHDIVKAFHSDTRNLAAGAILFTQPLYMGGKIRAYDRLTHYTELLADEKLSQAEQEIILETDRAYWQLVSLSHKKRLADSYRATLQKLDSDVQAMIREGVATKAQGLQVAVKLNEAEMTCLKVDDGLVLCRMLLCQLCGLPLDTPVRAQEEDAGELQVNTLKVSPQTDIAFVNRPELNQLELAGKIYAEKAKIVRADFLPQAAMIGGYAISNPNVYNGFQNKFAGAWAIGLTLKVPIWNWGEGRHKVRAAQAEAEMTALRAEEAREKITLQVTQESFRVNEAIRKLNLARKNLEKANENVRIADLGYREDVIPLTDLLAARTAWLQAHSEKIDAEIDVMLTRTAWRKALGTLRE